LARQLLMAVLMIGLAGSLAGGGLFAYLNDTETSTGNTFTAGEIDIELSGGGFASGPGTPAKTEFKPGETGYLVFTVSNVGTNPAYVWKHILDTTHGEENLINEPECECYGGTWDPDTSTCDLTDAVPGASQVGINDFEFGLSVSTNGGTTWIPLIPETVMVPLSTVVSKFLPLGTVPAGGSIIVRQSLRLLGESTGNWAQTDKLVIDEEYIAQQVGATPELPGTEYGGYIKPD
jgi:predicted ribosomally synthesized peptide with SipW-like signal peptide